MQERQPKISSVWLHWVCAGTAKAIKSSNKGVERVCEGRLLFIFKFDLSELIIVYRSGSFLNFNA